MHQVVLAGHLIVNMMSSAIGCKYFARKVVVYVQVHCNTDLEESKILCYMKPCKLGTLLVVQPGSIGELGFAMSPFLHSYYIQL